MLTHDTPIENDSRLSSRAPQHIARLWCAAMGITRGRSWSHRRFLLTLAAFALIARVIVAIGLETYLERIGLGGFTGADDAAYDRVSWTMAQHWHGIGPIVGVEEQYLVNVYTYVSGAVYYAFGHLPFAIKTLNCALGVVTVALVYCIAFQIFGTVAARFSSLFAAFFPTTFLWSTLNLKDTLFACFVLALFAFVTRLVITGDRRMIVPALVTMLLLGGVRLYAEVMLCILLPIVLFLQPNRTFRHKWSTAAIVLAGCLLLFYVSGASAWLGLSPGKELPQESYINPTRLNQQRQYAGQDGSTSFVQEPIPGSPQGSSGVADSGHSKIEAVLGLASWLPKGLAYVLAAPFPWMFRRPIDFALLPEILLWYSAMILAAIGAIANWRNWAKYLPLLGYLGGMAIILAVVSGNLGTLVRSRGMLIPGMLIFAGAGFAWLLARRTGDVSTKVSLLDSSTSQG